MGGRLCVAVLAGGCSGEHQVSLLSAGSIVSALDPKRYRIVIVGIDKDGRWLSLPTDDWTINSDDPERIALRDGPTISPPSPSEPWRLVQPANAGAEAEQVEIDVVFPVLHGTFGEDGTLQGLLDLSRLAYVGSGTLASSVAMDKDVAKRLLRDSGLPVVDWLALNYEDGPQGGLTGDELVKRLGLPLFVKPANLGSSVGINKVKQVEQLPAALAAAFEYDDKIIVESAVDAREIEISVLGGHLAQASVPGEVAPRHEFYSYDAKYIDQQGADLIIPADLSQELSDSIRELALQAFKCLGCYGMARVDFLLERGTEHVLINELNTIPGFTKISMYPKLWSASGLAYPELLDRLIELALVRKKLQTRLRRSYSPK